MIIRTSVRAQLPGKNWFTKKCSAAEHSLAVQAERDSRPFIPRASGRLRSSGKVIGNVISWNTPYAATMYYENVMVDPKTNAAGFRTSKGWRSRHGVKKIRSNRKYRYSEGGGQWFTRAKEKNIQKWLIQAEREVNGK